MTFKTTRTLAALSITLLLIAAPFLPLAAHQNDKIIVFRDVDVFDGSRMIRRTNVLVRDGMISDVGSDVTIPPSALIIDGKGKTLLPGFFDAHVHLGVYFAEQFLKDALNFGVTTELDMGGAESSLALRNKIIEGSLTDLPDLRIARNVITVPGGHPTQMDGPPVPTLKPNDDVQAFVDARIAEGSDYVKIVYEHAFATLTKQQLKDAVAAAHRRNKLAVVHITRQADARGAIAAGADGLVHIFADSAPEADFAEFAAQHDVFVTPTLSVLEMAAGGPAKPWWQDGAKLTPYVTTFTRRTLEMKFPPQFAARMKFAHAQAAVAALHRAGVPILAGTDAPSPGLAHGVSLHRELELLVLSGLSPLEALAAATSQPARAFGFHDRGRIKEGLRADLLLVNGDPSVDIKATRDIVGIWKLGVRHTRRTADSEPEKK